MTTRTRPTVLTNLEDLAERPDIAGKFPDWRGYQVIAPSGQAVGEVEAVYVDTKTDEAAFLALRLSGGGDRPWLDSVRTVLVPLRDVECVGERQLRVRPAEKQAPAPESQAAEEVAPHAEEEILPYFESWQVAD